MMWKLFKDEIKNMSNDQLKKLMKDKGYEIFVKEQDINYLERQILEIKKELNRRK